MSSAPNTTHQERSLRLTLELAPHVRAGELGRTFVAPYNVRFSPHDIVSPDLIVVGRDRLSIIGPQLIDGAPDLLIEILSPATRDVDQGRKMELYDRYGVREYWHVDLEARSVTVFALIDGRYEATVQEGAICSHARPGLSINLSALFVGLP